ncbi:MAG: 3-isopropylmalate dehydrogenase [Clostridiales bacterium]|jgi:3-isopropylmalate dehydrogenase|nr:3-isopropylmalate dehydrogenase [Clostridiales bacterium]
MKKIVVLPGDGIGPETMKQGLKVLRAISEKYSVEMEFEEYLMGGCAIDKYDNPYPPVTEKACLEADSVLLGAVGGPKWDNVEASKRAESGLLRLRKSLNAFANLRPAKLQPQLISSSSIKEEVLGESLDIMVVRELTGGAYFGEKGRRETENGMSAWDLMIYNTVEIKRVSRVAFEIAGLRNNKLTLVDKANVLESSRLWRETVTEMAKEYPDVMLNCMYVDNAAMQLIRNPSQFDVIVTENLFGDILSDEASMLTGSLGMLPSASLNENGKGIFEPIHGSAPDIAGKNIANPIATILSCGMMLQYSFKINEAANKIYDAVSNVLDKGYRCADIMMPSMIRVGTEEMGDLIAAEIYK